MTDVLLLIIVVELFWVLILLSYVVGKLNDILPIEIRFIGENGDKLRVIKEVKE